MLTAPLLQAERIVKEPAGKAKRMVPIARVMYVPHPAQFKTDPEKHDGTNFIRQEKTWVGRALWHCRTMVS